MNRTTPVSIAGCSTPCSRRWFPPRKAEAPWQRRWHLRSGPRFPGACLDLFAEWTLPRRRWRNPRPGGQFAPRSPAGVWSPAAGSAHCWGFTGLNRGALPSALARGARQRRWRQSGCCGAGGSVLWQPRCSRTLWVLEPAERLRLMASPFLFPFRCVMSDFWH